MGKQQEQKVEEQQEQVPPQAMNADTEVTPEEPTENPHHIRETTEKFWDSTKSAWNSATLKATQYKRLVQKKIDISALHKKISAAHTDLGKLIDDSREAGTQDILAQFEVEAIFQQLDELKTKAAALEQDVENLKKEAPVEENEPPEPQQKN